MKQAGSGQVDTNKDENRGVASKSLYKTSFSRDYEVPHFEYGYFGASFHSLSSRTKS